MAFCFPRLTVSPVVFSCSSGANLSIFSSRNGEYILPFGPALCFHIDDSSPTAFLDRQIYGGISLGIAAVAIISMFALSNVSIHSL
jgi:hypothetical protein